MFHRYSCGCISFNPDYHHPVHNQSYIVKPCDLDSADLGPYNLDTRQLSGSVEPLDTIESLRVFNDLAELVADGNRFREIRRLLG